MDQGSVYVNPWEYKMNRIIIGFHTQHQFKHCFLSQWVKGSNPHKSIIIDYFMKSFTFIEPLADSVLNNIIEGGNGCTFVRNNSKNSCQKMLTVIFVAWR